MRKAAGEGVVPFGHPDRVPRSCSHLLQIMFGFLGSSISADAFRIRPMISGQSSGVRDVPANKYL